MNMKTQKKNINFKINVSNICCVISESSLEYISSTKQKNTNWRQHYSTEDAASGFQLQTKKK
jgi:hypothetical protein